MNVSLRIVKSSQIRSVTSYHAGDFVVPKVAPQSLRPFLAGKLAQLDCRDGLLEETDWKSLLLHRDPLLGARLTPRPMTNVAIELVPSWPKSASILARFDNRLIQANAELAHRAIGLVEPFAFCRDQKGDESSVLKAYGLSAATFGHLISDAGDPHLHSHDLIFLFSRFSSKAESEVSLGSVWTTPVLANRELISARIAAEGAMLLAGLGCNIERDSQSFRIAGVPREFEIVFSRRTNEVDTAEIDALAEGGTFDNRQAAYVERRRPKKYKTLDSQWESWQHLDVGVQCEKDLCAVRDEAIWRSQNRSAEHMLALEERTRSALGHHLATSDLLAASTAEITVLRELPGESSASTFASAIRLIQPQEAMVGNHAFLVGGKLRAALPDLDALVGNVTGGERRQLAGTRSIASQFAIQSAPDRILLIESPSPPLTVAACSQLAQNRAAHQPVKVVDASILTSQELASVLRKADLASERLVLVAPHPSRTSCTAASALACPDLVSNPVTVFRESLTPHTQPCDIHCPPTARFIEANSWDFSRYVPEILSSSESVPLFITSTQSHAKEINQIAHDLVNKEISVPHLRESKRLHLPDGETSDAYLDAPQSGLGKGQVVRALGKADGISLSDGTSIPTMIPLHRQSQLRYLDGSNVSLGKDEPVFRLHQFSLGSPFEPADVMDRTSGRDVQSAQFRWAVGFAASLDELPNKPFHVETVVWCGSEAGFSLAMERKLRAYMHSAKDPVVLSANGTEGLGRRLGGVDDVASKGTTPDAHFSDEPELPLP